jgi:ankyrin repeat protein
VRERNELSGPPDFEAAAAAADDWFTALRNAGRVGRTEADVRFILGVEQRLPTVYGAPDSEQAWHDTDVCAAIRGGADLEAATAASLLELIGLAVRCGDPIALERVLAAGGSSLDPGEIVLDEFGGTCCVVRDGAESTYFGPRTADLLAVISLLREAGFDLDVADGDGETLLTDAAARSEALVAFMISMSAGVDQPNARGETPLIVAVAFSQTAIAQRLLSHGASVNAEDVDGATALHRAAAGDDPDLLMLLLDNGADPNAGSKLGETPLMAASSAAVASTLCAAGADPNATSNSGQTPLMHAANRGIDKLLRALLDAGADPDAATDLGETALHLAAIAPSGPDAVASGILLDAGADIDEETNDGVTPLMLAARWAKPDLTRFLVARGADVNRQAPNGITALMFASDGRQEWDRDPTVVDRMQRCIRLLVEAGADVNTTNARGETALHWATTGFHAGPVAELLELGADPNLPTADGVTPLAYLRAHERPHEQMIEDLVAAGARDDARKDP